MKKFRSNLNDLWNLVLDHKKQVMPVVLILCVALTVFLAMRANEQAKAAVGNAERAAGEFEVPVTEALVNAYPEVNALIREYYDAWAAGDMDTIDRLYRTLDETERLTTIELSKYIEDVSDIDVYTKPGPVEGSYVVYANITVKFHDYDEQVSGVHALYVCTDEDGSLYINSEISDDNVKEYIREICLQNDIIDLYNSVSARFNEMRTQDEVLDRFLSGMLGDTAVAVGEALAVNTSGGADPSTGSGAAGEGTDVASAGPSTGSGTASEGEETGSDVAGSSTSAVTAETAGSTALSILRATDVVNIRTSDSETADKIAKTEIGDEFTQLEARANGWSRIRYEGRDAFVKTEFFEVIGTVEGDAGTSTASTGSATAGTASATASTGVSTAGTSTGSVTAGATASTTASSAGVSTGATTAGTASMGVSTGATTANTTAGGITTAGSYHVKETTRIRKSASTDSDIVAVAYEKNPIEVVSVRADGWSQVKYQGKDGYCMTQYITE